MKGCERRLHLAIGGRRRVGRWWCSSMEAAMWIVVRHDAGLEGVKWNVRNVWLVGKASWL